jgi:hypothetical protein
MYSEDRELIIEETQSPPPARAGLEVVKDVITVKVYFQLPDGTDLATRQFDPGQALRILVQVRGVLGLPEPWLKITLDIHATSGTFAPIYDEGSTSILGNYAFYISLPNTTAQADCIVTVYPVVGSGLQVITPIGIGEGPPPLPKPPATTLETVLKWVAIGGGVIAVAWMASKAAPSIKRGFAKEKSTSPAS